MRGGTTQAHDRNAAARGDWDAHRAAVVVLVAAISLIAQWRVSTGLMAGAGQTEVIWRMLGYFTVLSNLGAVVVLGGVALRGRIGSHAAGAITVILIVVGLTYHAVLSGLWAPVGLAWWADQGLHTAVPVLVVMWWVLFAPKAGLVGRDALLWLVWPLAYCGYALLRGGLTGFYPYPFIDVPALGLAQVALNTGLMAAGFVLLGLGIVGTARVIR